MKISILIPVYNFDVKKLVEDLCFQSQQAINLKDFEILVYDDGSRDRFSNAELQSDKIKYKELDENLGRSKIRNLLASNAQFDVLLFLDCDSAVVKDDFIKSYVQHYQDESVVYGGRTYLKEAPEDSTYFRWKYGMEREIVSADKRIQNPYRGFMTNNFLISKSVFLKLKLDESLVGYGHEDTLFGIELERAKIPIVHIENPAAHIGLEPTEVYLEKTKEGIVNLMKLYREKKLQIRHVKLLSYYAKFNIFPLKQFFNWYYKRNQEKIESNLKTKTVNIRNFDLYKLYIILNL